MQETPTYVYVEDLQDSGAAATGSWSVLSECTVWVSHVLLTIVHAERQWRSPPKLGHPEGLSGGNTCLPQRT